MNEIVHMDILLPAVCIFSFIFGMADERKHARGKLAFSYAGQRLNASARALATPEGMKGRPRHS